MRILILIFSLIFGGSGIAQDFREYGFAMMTDSKCDNHEEAMKYLKKVVAYVEANAPNSNICKVWKRFRGQAGLPCYD